MTNKDFSQMTEEEIKAMEKELMNDIIKGVSKPKKTFATQQKVSVKDLISHLSVEITDELLSEAFDQADVAETDKKCKAVLKEITAKQEDILEALYQTLVSEVESIITDNWGE